MVQKGNEFMTKVSCVMHIRTLFSGQRIETQDQTREKLIKKIHKHVGKAVSSETGNDVPWELAAQYVDLINGVYTKVMEEDSYKRLARGRSLHDVYAVYKNGQDILVDSGLKSSEAREVSFHIRNVAGLTMVSSKPFIALDLDAFSNFLHNRKNFCARYADSYDDSGVYLIVPCECAGDALGVERDAKRMKKEQGIRMSVKLDATVHDILGGGLVMK